MKTISIALLMLLSILSLTSCSQDTKSNDNIKVLAICPDKLGANFNLYIDNMEKYGWEVCWAGLTETVNTCSYSSAFGHIPISVDTLIQDITDITYWDAIMIMPAKWWSGNAYGDLLDTPEVLSLLQQANENNKVIWATCAGVRVLAAADILNGVNVTGREEYASEYIAAGANYLGADIPPVIDGNIITSTRGKYYHYQNITAILTSIIGNSKKDITQHDSYSTKQINYIRNDKNDLIWSKTFGGNLSDGASSVIMTNDEKILFCGYTYSPDNNSNVLLIKTDGEGNELWTSSYGGDGWEYANSIIEAESGDIYMVGQTSSEGMGLQDIFILKTTSDGELIWSKTFGGTELDIGVSICETTDDHILVCGYTESFGEGEDDVFVIKIDQWGNEIWSKTFGGSASDMGRDIIEDSNGDYLVVGNTGSFGSGNRDVYLLKLDADGELIWSETYGANDYQDAFAIIEYSDGGYVIAGQSETSGSDLLDAYILKTDADGELTWSKKYEGSENFYDYAKDIIEIPEGNLLVCGHSKIRENRNNVSLIFLLNPDGNQLWMNEYGVEGTAWTNSICKANDGNYVLTGHMKLSSDNDFGAWLIKLQNPLVGIEKKIENIADVKIFPNPVSTDTKILFNNKDHLFRKLEINDIYGRSIKKFDTSSLDDQHIYWDATNERGQKVIPGVYTLNLYGENAHICKKIVVVN